MTFHDEDFFNKERKCSLTETKYMIKQVNTSISMKILQM